MPSLSSPPPTPVSLPVGPSPRLSSAARVGGGVSSSRCARHVRANGKRKGSPALALAHYTCCRSNAGASLPCSTPVEPRQPTWQEQCPLCQCLLHSGCRRGAGKRTLQAEFLERLLSAVALALLAMRVSAPLRACLCLDQTSSQTGTRKVSIDVRARAQEI